MGVCFKGSTELAELLIAHGADVNARNFSGTTPLVFAAMFEQEKIATLLLEKGADKTLRDVQGKTAYDYAKTKGSPAMEKLLKV